MKRIDLKTGTMLVDDDFVAPSYIRIDRDGYAEAHIYVGRRAGRSLLRYVRVHRLVMGAKAGQQVDHINGNRLDNRRENLRFCTARENARNRRGARGITWHRGCKKWQATIKVDGRSIYLGVYVSMEQARGARRAAELRYFGAFAPAGAA